MEISVGMRFRGNVNNAEFEVIDTKEGMVTYIDLKTGRIHFYGLETF